MDISGSTLERLRRQLVDLESKQRAVGGRARPQFWKAPPPDAGAPPPSDAAGPGSSDTAGLGALAPTLAFAVGITALPDLQPSSLDEEDLFESVAQLGHLQHHREVVLVRLVGDIEARGLPSAFADLPTAA